MPQDFFTEISLSQERTSSSSLPDILLESGTQLVKLAYHTQTQKYQYQTTVDLEKTSYPPSSCELLALSDSIIVGKNIESRHNQEETEQFLSKVIKLSPSLEQLNVYECADVAAMATDGKHIFVSTEGKLVALNQDLETLDEVDLKLNSWGWRGKKNAHDILIHQSIAYLLDNVVEPTYILRVDISNPSNLQIMSTFEITGVNHHLTRQWINGDLNQWFIVQYYATQADSGENIIILPLDLETGHIDISNSQFSFSPTWFNENSINLLKLQSGSSLIAVTSFSPTWGVLHEEDKGLYLTQGASTKHQIKFENKLYLGDLKDCSSLKSKIIPIEQLLFIVIQGYKKQCSFTRLLILDVAQAPSIILNQDLEVQSLDNLTMSYLLLSQN